MTPADATSSIAGSPLRHGTGSAAIAHDARLSAVIDRFRAEPTLRVLAVVDQQRRPVGVIRELDVRSILFNPFGHALMQNPTIGGTLGSLIRTCPIADEGVSLARLLDLYAAAGGAHGMILTPARPVSLDPRSRRLCPAELRTRGGRGAGKGIPR